MLRSDVLRSMDVDQARDLAVAEFASRMAGPGETWRPEDWEVSGPHEEEVYGVDGLRPCLVFNFVKRYAGDSATFPLMIAVDKEARAADMLR
jgi:hypothetical protein